jgi:hypothetical protein
MTTISTETDPYAGLDAKAAQLARSTMGLDNVRAWARLLFLSQTLGLPGDAQTALRNKAWAFRQSLAQVETERAREQFVYAAPDAPLLGATKPEPPATNPPAAEVTEPPPPPLAETIGVAPATPAKPGRPLIGLGQPGQRWGIQRL